VTLEVNPLAKRIGEINRDIDEWGVEAVASGSILTAKVDTALVEVVAGVVDFGGDDNGNIDAVVSTVALEVDTTLDSVVAGIVDFGWDDDRDIDAVAVAPAAEVDAAAEEVVEGAVDADGDDDGDVDLAFEELLQLTRRGAVARA